MRRLAPHPLLSQTETEARILSGLPLVPRGLCDADVHFFFVLHLAFLDWTDEREYSALWLNFGLALLQQFVFGRKHSSVIEGGQEYAIVLDEVCTVNLLSCSLSPYFLPFGKDDGSGRVWSEQTGNCVRKLHITPDGEEMCNST